MSAEQIELLVQRVESRYIQGQIDLETAMALINDLRGNYA